MKPRPGCGIGRFARRPLVAPAARRAAHAEPARRRTRNARVARRRRRLV